MPAPVPKPKSTELIDRINPELSRDPPNEVAVEKVRREADVLLRTPGHDGEAHSVLGMVSTIKLIPKDVLGHFRKSLQLAGGDDGINASISYLRVGLFSEACSLAEGMFGNHPDNIEMLNQAAIIFARTLQFSNAKLVYDALRKLGKDLPETFFETHGRDFVELLRREKVEESALLPVLESAASVVVTKFHKPLLESFYSMTTVGQLAYSFGVHATSDEIVDMNFAIADQIVSSFEETHAALLTISCLPHREPT